MTKLHRIGTERQIGSDDYTTGVPSQECQIENAKLPGEQNTVSVQIQNDQNPNYAEITGPWWSSGLERQPYDILVYSRPRVRRLIFNSLAKFGQENQSFAIDSRNIDFQNRAQNWHPRRV